MAEKDSVNEEGTKESANSESSNNSNSQRGSVKEVNVVEQLGALQRQVEALTRGLQSDKDRAVKATNKRLDAVEGDIRELLQEARKNGRSVDDLLADIDAAEEAENRQAMRELVKRLRGGQNSLSLDWQSREGDVNTSAVVEELELDTEDVRVKELLARKFTSEAEAYREGAKLLKSISKTQPTDADKASDVARQQIRPAKQDELKREYEEGSQKLFGRQLLEYQRKMREKGLEI